MLDLDLFGEDNIDFFENKMWLDLQDIQQEINTSSTHPKSYYLQLFTKMKEKYLYFSDKYKHTPIENSGEIKRELYREFKNIDTSDEGHNIAQELLHMFQSFCQGGIEDAWLYSTHDEWYPQIIFKERIESDIHLLSETMIVYRGTNRKEYESGHYGQAWTLSRGIAEKFAYSQYKHSIRSHGERTVLQATVSQDDVFYYKKETTAKEDEVIVNSEKLTDIIVFPRSKK
jgi:hypothetical protein